MSSLARSAGEVSRSDGGGCCSEGSPLVEAAPLRRCAPPPPAVPGEDKAPKNQR